ncbi:type II secretion system F family protein [Microvirga sp. VF16]|uniref:type II secretion system F family protein n=1 Tax=Microvirga sp. VF16 TaxID=2807101 RepID=UPI00193CEAE6|nr:type II secretion system F family protein [Microvirga sp. VF16]QRM35028.1 type II secretion system F family protein [Microvirga sp. VF16]
MLASQIVIGLCSFVAVGSVSYALLSPKISDESVAATRLSKLTKEGAAVSAKAVLDRRRRRAVVHNLEDLQAEEKSRKNIPIDVLIRQAGLDWTNQRYYLMMASGVIITSVTVYVLSMSLLATAIATLVAPMVWPKMYVSRLREKRIQKFLDQFPTGLDIIIRGLKSGLPIRTCMVTIATEAEEPLRSEFQAVMQAQSLGMTVADAVARMRLTVPSPETNFFITLIEVQQSAGSNLAETLQTLSNMMRARKQMREKIKSLAAQPKMSAYIIAAVPVVVMVAVQFISPEYLEPLFYTTLGHVVLGACILWAGFGALLMKSFMKIKI